MFLLTLIGVTLPVALAAGLVYKMGRLFELRRPRTSGARAGRGDRKRVDRLFHDLNVHAPAAALLLARRPRFSRPARFVPVKQRGGWRWRDFPRRWPRRSTRRP